VSRPPLEQLSFFGPAAVIPEPEPLPPPPPEPPPPVEPADPRQCGLFEGPLADSGALEAACEELDVAAARAVWRRAAHRFPEWARAQRWPAWLADLAWLVGPSRQLDPQERLARVDALGAPAAGEARFDGMAASLHARILDAAVAQTAYELVAEHGATAGLPDGRPAGCLLLDARPAEAAALLSAAAVTAPHDGLTHLYLGEAYWRCRRHAAALGAYLDALLVAPASVDVERVSHPLVHDLIDRAAELELPGAAPAWAPVLADLEGAVSLLNAAVEPPADGPAATEVARLLLTYRRQRRSGALAEPERLALKRAMLRAAPQLKELVRRL
jgi:tetratricopeptide (TPR) repeat protein